MKRHVFVAALMLTSVSVSPSFASGPAGTKTFQGEGFIETVTSTCTSLNDAAVGDYYRMVYLYQGTSLLQREGLSLIGPRGAYLIQPVIGSLNGSVATTSTGIGSHATLYTQLGSSNLTISSVGGLATADAINLKVIGTLSGLYDTGCDVTIHAVLVARPD